MIKFTRHDLPKDSKSLLNFLMSADIKVADKNINGCLCAVWEKSRAIKKLQAHIKRNENEQRLRKHIPMWKKNLEILKGLK